MTIKATDFKLPPGEATEGGNASGIAASAGSSAVSGVRFSSLLLLYLDRWRKIIFAGIALLYLLGFNGQWLIEPDGGLYLNLARNLALGRGYTYGGVRHETVYPGLPVALAGLYRIFPSHFIFAADVLMLLCAFATLALIYRLVLPAYDRGTAVAIVVGVAASHEFFRYSFEILSDMPFLMGVMAVLAGHEAVFESKGRRVRWWDWLLLIAGLIVVIATRPTMIGLLAAWVASLVWLVAVRRNLMAGGAIAICGVMLAIFLLFDPRRFGEHGVAGGYEQYAIFQLSHAHALAVTAVANVHDLLSTTLAKAAFGMRLGPDWISAIFGIIAATAAVALIRKRLLWGLWVIVTFGTLVVFVSNERYLLAILPLSVIGWWNLLRAIDLRLPRKTGNALFAALLFVGLGPNFTEVIGTIMQQRSRPFLQAYQRGRYEAFARLAPEVGRLTSPEDVVICPPKTARMMAFWTDRACYEPNEPFARPQSSRVYVILDPADEDYMSWLRNSRNIPQENVVARANRSGNEPDISLAWTIW